MWIYQQATGELLDPNGKLFAKGYSGKGEGKNNPSMQHVKATGPIPVGYWRIGKPYDSKKVGPFALPLTPIEGTETFGRSAFLCHGDNSTGTASEGCIIFPQRVRHAIWDSGDRALKVV